MKSEKLNLSSYITMWQQRAINESIKISDARLKLIDLQELLDEAKEALSLGDDGWAEAVINRASVCVSEAVKGLGDSNA